MISYEEMKANHEIIKEMCKKYRKELTVIGGIIGEYYDLITCHEYIKFMNELSDDKFVGNYLQTIIIPEGIERYKRVLNEENSIDEFAFESLLNSEKLFKIYKEKVSC